MASATPSPIIMQTNGYPPILKYHITGNPSPVDIYSAWTTAISISADAMTQRTAIAITKAIVVRCKPDTRTPLSAYPKSRLYFNLGQLHLAQGSIRQAVSYLNEALDMDPDIAVGWFFFGNLLFKIKKFGQAKAAFDIAMRLIEDAGKGNSVDYRPQGLDISLHMTQVRFNSDLALQTVLNEQNEKDEANKQEPLIGWNLAVAGGDRSMMSSSSRSGSSSGPKLNYTQPHLLPFVLFRPVKGTLPKEDSGFDPAWLDEEEDFWKSQTEHSDTTNSSARKAAASKVTLAKKGFKGFFDKVVRKRSDSEQAAKTGKKGPNTPGLVTTASTLSDFLRFQQQRGTPNPSVRPIITHPVLATPVSGLSSTRPSPFPREPLRLVTEDQATRARLEGAVPGFELEDLVPWNPHLQDFDGYLKQVARSGDGETEPRTEESWAAWEAQMEKEARWAGERRQIQNVNWVRPHPGGPDGDFPQFPLFDQSPPRHHFAPSPPSRPFVQAQSTLPARYRHRAPTTAPGATFQQRTGPGQRPVQWGAAAAGGVERLGMTNHQAPPHQLRPAPTQVLGSGPMRGPNNNPPPMAYQPQQRAMPLLPQGRQPAIRFQQTGPPPPAPAPGPGWHWPQQPNAGGQGPFQPHR